MRSWIHWINTRAKNFDMLRSILDSSVWFLDSSYQQLCQVNGQSNESNQSDKSTQCDKSIESHQCTSHTNRTCNCANGFCADSDARGDYFGASRNQDGSQDRKQTRITARIENNRKYRSEARPKTRASEIKGTRAWVWDCYEYANANTSIHDTEPTDHRSNQHGARE